MMQKAIKERLEWATAITVDAAFILTGLGLLIFARFTDLPDWPWMYIGFFIAAVGLVGELILGVARADQMSHHPTNLRPKR
jgi:hypothetical protein